MKKTKAQDIKRYLEYAGVNYYAYMKKSQVPKQTFQATHVDLLEGIWSHPRLLVRGLSPVPASSSPGF